MVGQEAVDDPPTPSELHTLQSAVSETSAIDHMSESDPVHGDSETTATTDGPVVGLMVGQEAGYLRNELGHSGNLLNSCFWSFRYN